MMQPHATSNDFPSFLANDEDQQRSRDTFDVNDGRLVGVRNSYDPTNIFRVNRNVQPTT
jgi:hypothetical protein